MQGRSGLPGGDRRRIQTAVLGAADSQEPLVLPLEAIELDAFRQQYEDQTFWCGSWLGGCGRQLMTKLYLDRACHFAHHADADATRPPCTRRARDVTSADHLYVRAAAEGLLQAQRMQGEAVCSQPGHAPAGSVVRLRLSDDNELTIHMSAAVAPEWESAQGAGCIVVEDQVPVSRRVLQRLRYVHRIRCESHGTGRRVLLGTQTSRGTQWFEPEECSLGPEGLVTPVLRDLPDRPVVRPPGPRPDAEEQRPARISEEVRRFLLRLATARRSRDLAGTRALIKECDGMLSRRGTPPPALREARDSAARWLVERSKEVIKQGRNGKTTVLTGAAAEREVKERQRQKESIAAERQTLVHELQVALRYDHFGDVRILLRSISKLTGGGPARPEEAEVLRGAREQLDSGVKLGVLQMQVARRHWLQRNCPTCEATAGKECFDEAPNGDQQLRRVGGHDARLLLVVASREKVEARKRAQRAEARAATRGTK